MSNGLAEREATELFLTQPNTETYSALFRVVAPQLVSFFRLRGCLSDAAEDLTQEVMLSVFRQHTQLRDRSLFRPWLFRIARNALHRFRRNQSVEPALSDVHLEAKQVPDSTIDPLISAQFSQWMQTLNPDEREAMLLRYVEGFEYHEIAELLETPVGTIQWRIFQSKKKLALRFGGGI